MSYPPPPFFFEAEVPKKMGFGGSGMSEAAFFALTCGVIVISLTVIGCVCYCAWKKDKLKRRRTKRKKSARSNSQDSSTNEVDNSDDDVLITSSRPDFGGTNNFEEHSNGYRDIQPGGEVDDEER